jgi:SAM-dependent methyltransferase
MSDDQHAAAIAANHHTWEAWAPHHFASPGYDIPSFKAGRETLDPISLAGVGDVRGKTLLHLQCHFGLDTMSWARHGATVTGVDFSATAIAKAREIAADLGLPADFVCCNVYDAPTHLDRQFDVVFTSVGALGWLPELEGWARVVATCLKPGGRFFVFEGHPTAFLFDPLPPAGMRLMYPYFAREVLIEPETGSYAAPDSGTQVMTHNFAHPLADILGSLLRAGLRITAYDEYPWLRWQGFPWMTRRDQFFWELPKDLGEIPMMFALTATR